MLKTLKFVAGAIDKKALSPYMSHFVIKDKRATAYNGIISLSSPIPIDITCKPKADTLIKAISSCKDTITLALTDTGRLRVQSGKFKAFIECLTEDSPKFLPEGKIVDLDGKQLLKAFNALYKFTSKDSQHLWSTGILLSNGSAYATNNVVAVEHWLGFSPDIPINIPKQAIREIIRINEVPETIQIAERSATFQYSDGRWIKTQLLETKWPDVKKILDKESNPKPIDPEIFNGLKILKPFVEGSGRIQFTPGSMSTLSDLTAGSLYNVDSVDFTATFNNAMLELLDGVATSIDWNQSSALFFGDELRGAIIGIKSR